MKVRELVALGALVLVLAITGVWWALALWPLPGEAPAWLLRTRAVCFGSAANGLPTTAGWMALIGQPLYMLATLWLIWGETVARGLRGLAGFRTGRAALHGSAVLLLAGLAAAGVRVARAAGTSLASASLPPVPPADVPRLDRPAPPLELVDQRGQTVTLEQFRGRAVLLTFAYAHCQTVCPLVVQDVLRAAERARDLEPPPAVLVVTLDPWRDRPARLAAIAEHWRLGGGTDARVLSGEVPAVEATLDRWQVARQRSPKTGEVRHPALVYVIDRRGRIAFAVSGSATTIEALARRL